MDNGTDSLEDEEIMEELEMTNEELEVKIDEEAMEEERLEE